MCIRDRCNVYTFVVFSASSPYRVPTHAQMQSILNSFEQFKLEIQKTYGAMRFWAGRENHYVVNRELVDLESRITKDIPELLARLKSVKSESYRDHQRIRSLTKDNEKLREENDVLRSRIYSYEADMDCYCLLYTSPSPRDS